MAGIILFDGVCNLCDRTVQFIIKRDPEAYFSFASLQSETGQKLLAQHGLDQEIDSFVLIEHHKCYVKSEASLRVCRKLKGFCKFFYALRIIPRPVRDFGYEIMAKNRYKWFGKKESCLLPTPETKKRFLP